MDEAGRAVVVGLGEVLWDMLPSGKQLGGAPANFAYHAQALGAHGSIASSVGDDDLGREILGRLDGLGIDRRHVQVNPARPTSTVTVRLDGGGHPSYTIHEDVAWDFLELTDPLLQLIASADAVCVGSLAQRSPDARATIQRLLQVMPDRALRVFDINLRQQYYTPETILSTLNKCNVLKLNDEEWPVVARFAGLDAALPAGPEVLRRQYGLRLVAMTRGGSGSTIYAEGGISQVKSNPVKVVDTVGAGDSFTAALTMGLLRGKPLQEVHQHASDVAAFVCTQNGATPTLPQDLKQA